MKQREFKKCVFCEKGVMHAGDIQFFTVQVKSYLINPTAVRQQAGLEIQIGAQLAAVMGPDADLAVQVTDTGEQFMCQSCAFARGGDLMNIMEIVADKEREQTEINEESACSS